MALTGVTNRKYFADLFPELYTKATVQRSTATVTVKSPAGEGEFSVDPVGQCLIYDGAAGEYVLYRTGDTIPVTGDVGDEAYNAKVAVLTGGPQGIHDNAVDLVITEAGVTATVTFKEATCVTDRLGFHTGVSAGEKTAFVNALRDQGIEKKGEATEVNPSYTA